MRGLISYHPVDPGFFETLIGPLLRGEKVNPECFLESARRLRRASRTTLGYKRALELLLEELEPPPPLQQGTMWERVRSRLDRFDYRVPALARVLKEKIVADLELQGRPFLVTERSTDRAIETVAEFAQADGDGSIGDLVRGQLKHLSAELASEVEPEYVEEPSSDSSYRNDLLADLKKIHDWGQAVRDGESAASLDRRSRNEMTRELPWRIVYLHSRAVPFWVAHDVEGLETICRAAGIEPPAWLAAASSLFACACSDFPELHEPMQSRMRNEQGLGVYVAPEDVPALIEFLQENGTRIIQVAARHKQGTLCANLLRKIRECAGFAEQHGVGYLEASGIYPLLEEPAPVAAAPCA